MVVAEMNDLIDALIESVRTQVQDSKTIEEITEKLAQKKYRQFFLILNSLKESGRWILSESDKKNLEKFWWEYAN